jgi:hypothetical protein
MANYRYRDIKTGRFVKEEKWRRERARPRRKYKRERIKKPLPPPEPPEPPAIIYEWLIVFTYQDSGRTFDVISTATNDAEAKDVAEIFLRTDPRASKMFDIRGKLKRGWVTSIVRSSRTREEVGEAEYRSESEG